MAFDQLPVEVLTKIFGTSCEVETFRQVCRNAREASYGCCRVFRLPPDVPIAAWQIECISRIHGHTTLDVENGAHTHANAILALERTSHVKDLTFWCQGDLSADMYSQLVRIRPRGRTHIFVSGHLHIGDTHRPTSGRPVFTIDCQGELHADNADPCIESITCRHAEGDRRGFTGLRSLYMYEAFNGAPFNPETLHFELSTLTSLRLRDSPLVALSSRLSSLLVASPSLRQLSLWYLSEPFEPWVEIIASSLPALVNLDLHVRTNPGAEAPSPVAFPPELERLQLYATPRLARLAVISPSLSKLTHLKLERVSLEESTVAHMRDLRSADFQALDVATAKRLADTAARVSCRLGQVTFRYFELHAEVDRAIDGTTDLWPGFCPGLHVDVWMWRCFQQLTLVRGKLNFRRRY